MKVLVVCRKGTASRPYITEQIKALEKNGVEIEIYYLTGSGISGYIFKYKELKKKLKEYKPDLIHAHYGLSGLFANIQRKIPVVTSFHGSDINFKKIRPFSVLAKQLSAYNIFVSEKLSRKAKAKQKYVIQPCGIDLNDFYPIDKKIAREKLGLELNIPCVLFSGSYLNRIKNSVLAKQAIKRLSGKIKLIELRGYSRSEVNLLFNACDVALMTSLMEGSPQFIKEAMACNCPIVSTNVGSVEEIIADTNGCYLTSFDPKDVSDKLQMALQFEGRTNGRSKIKYLDNNLVALAIIEVYTKAIK